MTTRHILLIGFMGTGKSTVGAQLARNLNYAFVDLDAEIVKQVGRSIPDIFAQEGEAFFREQESRILTRLLRDRTRQLVIATGGGVVLSEANCKLMREHGSVIQLTAEEETIVQRVSQDRNRPLLQGDAASRVRKLMHERQGLYDFAHLSVPTDRLTVEQINECIEAYLVSDKTY
ncbi:shikimate kinase [Paenibacillus apiarius]|uniref:Shikimate kinase n=1 Tax=Paenibacillus apiarius TaxID=46240 RepID=A0ABT4DLH7_9BACL|nr:shikimate kinase [Paenibacillus apiarius]MCY9513647.1 shikimate kinase [Paenibacillus apiarius]MCY9518198.1 shikimate kinase [Paenibacillus apiarius]MCY9551401.1 shikimate kinase [Paenibacillus apiarius]MCY9558555.1 shikimate kinase [Paenibacillus apiarius]MCY9684131.1 shikimate kinase [Paenibacillus apiarius]